MKNNVLFRSFITKINITFVDSAEDLDIDMPIHNFLEHSDNYSMTSESLWNYYRDDTNDDADENNAAKNKINSNKTITTKSFEYKRELIGSTPNNNNILDAEVVVPFRYLSNFLRSLDLLLINFEIELDLSWSKVCIISEISITPAVSGNTDAIPPVLKVAAIQATGATFQINNVKLYVPVVPLSTNDNIKF